MIFLMSNLSEADFLHRTARPSPASTLAVAVVVAWADPVVVSVVDLAPALVAVVVLAVDMAVDPWVVAPRSSSLT